MAVNGTALVAHQGCLDHWGHIGGYVKLDAQHITAACRCMREMPVAERMMPG